MYEASGRIGGRMFSNNTYWDANQVTEWCGELIDTQHTTVTGLARRFDHRLDNLLGAQPPRSDDIYNAVDDQIRDHVVCRRLHPDGRQVACNRRQIADIRIV